MGPVAYHVHHSIDFKGPALGIYEKTMKGSSPVDTFLTANSARITGKVGKRAYPSNN